MPRSNSRYGVDPKHVTIFACLWLATPLSLAQGRWSARVIDLPNPSSDFSVCGGPGLIATDMIVNGAVHAAYWSMQDGQWHDVNPPGATSSHVSCAGTHRLGGYAYFNGVAHAGAWNRDAQFTWIDLHPTGYSASSVSALDDTSSLIYVGNATFSNNGHVHATVWRESGETFLDLTTPGDSSPTFIGEYARSVSQTRVGGAVVSPGQGGRQNDHPTVWDAVSGTGSLAGDILGGSESVNGFVGSTPVGSALIVVPPGANWSYHEPIAWVGGVRGSIAPQNLGYGIEGGIRAARNTLIAGWGATYYENVPIHALVWSAPSRTAATDLSRILPGDTTNSDAYDVWRQGTVDVVAGRAWNSGLGNIVLWSKTTCIADVANTFGVGVPDGAVTVDDLLVYLADFEDGIFTADLDNGTGTATRDGAVTIDDLLFFLAHFEAGC